MHYLGKKAFSDGGSGEMEMGGNTKLSCDFVGRGELNIRGA